MMLYLFPQPYDYSDPYWVIKGFFDIMYTDGSFVEAIECLADGHGIASDSAVCEFAVDNEYKEDYEGVWFGYGYGDDYVVIVDERTCYDFARKAAALYLQRHPEDRAKLEGFLSRFPPQVEGAEA